MAQKSTFPSPQRARGAAHDFSGQIRELEDAGCDVVFVVATLADTSGIATAFAGRPEFTPTVIGQSPTWQTAFAQNPWLQEHFLLVAEGPGLRRPQRARHGRT